MKIIRLLVVALVTVLAGCGSGNSTGGGGDNGSGSVSAFNLPSESVKSTPQINGTISTSISALKTIGTLSSNTRSAIEDFFKLECHTDNNSLDFCPTGVDNTGLDTKFSTTTLIGLVQHADMYLANVYTPDEVVDPETGESTSTPTYQTCEKGANPVELTNSIPVYSPINADTFIVDFGTLFDCVGGFDFGGTSTSYALYSKSTDNLVFASLMSRKQIQGTESYTGVMSDIFQSYIRRNLSGDPIILGFNLAGFDEKGDNDYAGRAQLLTNISSSKFAVKYTSGTAADNYKQIVAIGRAGYDPSSSTWVTGYYMVKAKFGTSDAETVCIQNGLTPTIVDDSNCSDFSGFFSETGWAIGDIYTYLEANATDQTNLAGFEDFFGNDDFLATGATVLPANNSDYFPDTISN